MMIRDVEDEINVKSWSFLLVPSRRPWAHTFSAFPIPTFLDRLLFAMFPVFLGKSNDV